MVYFKTFSRKQLQLLTWWTENSPFSSYNGVIAEGAVRSGKSIIGALSFVLWAAENYRNMQFAICGKTIGSLRRNLITPIKEVLINRGFRVLDRKTENHLIISNGKYSNTFYLFGGRDERSQDLVQGITLAGIFLDEVALMPRSFVEQAMARCSVSGAKFWFNCNPEGPKHWFYVEHVLRAKEMRYLRIHFDIEDNPSLDAQTINRYKTMFTGIFYKRFILGEWAFADGVIYDSFNDEHNTYTNSTREQVLPYRIRENDPQGGYPWYSADYGVQNPMVYLECYKIRKAGDPTPYFYVENEYYYDGRKKMRQKTDQEYLEDYIRFVGTKHNKGLIIDPSATSLIAAMRKRGIQVYKAKNDVNEGIALVHNLFSTGHIMINKDNCPNLVSELGLYVWNEKKTDSGKEVPVKQNDHACDALRYFIQTTTNKYEVM